MSTPDTHLVSSPIEDAQSERGGKSVVEATIADSQESGASPPQLRAAQEQFITTWGEMGSNWGIPRTMAEVHALLFILGRPQNMDDVMQYLQVSRGSASTTLRALVEWGLIRRVHRRGDRKEYFEAEQDVGTLFRAILRERKKRELDPLLDSLRRCRNLTSDLDGEAASGVDPDLLTDHHARLDGMLSFVTMIDALTSSLAGPAGPGLQQAANAIFQSIEQNQDGGADA